MKITCPKRKAISIKSAFYGRHGNETCRHDLAPPEADCHDTKALSMLRQLCNAYESCGVDIFASKLGDPCPGIYKYANVTYKCIGKCKQCFLAVLVRAFVQEQHCPFVLSVMLYVIWTGKIHCGMVTILVDGVYKIERIKGLMLSKLVPPMRL